MKPLSVNADLQHYLTDALRAVVEQAHGASVNAGWWEGVDKTDPLVICTKLCLIHSEISEAMEGFRKNLLDDHLFHRQMVEVELADAVIRIADLAGALGLDLGAAFVEKSIYNEQRADHKKEAREAAQGKKF